MPLRGGMEIDSFMQNPSDGPSRRKKEKEKGRKRQMRRWALTVLLASFLITALLSLASGEIIEGLPMFASILVLILFVALGIVFDIIGLAVATADVTAFNSMAARRLKTGKKAVWLISNTEKVSSVCNDVIGDIAGVTSIPCYMQLVYGGFAFGTVFMATDPVTSAQTECGKWIYGLLIGALCVMVRLFNPGYVEGMMLAILLCNTFAPLIDHIVVNLHSSRKAKKLKVA